MPRTPDELSGLIALEQSIDRAHVAAWAREAQRARGVAWSGFGPARPEERTPQALAAAAAGKLASRRAWRMSSTGQLLAAVAETQRAAAAAHSAGDQIRAAIARSEETSAAACLAAALELSQLTHAACRSARRARRAARRAADEPAS
jgi:hypothetical protein